MKKKAKNNKKVLSSKDKKAIAECVKIVLHYLEKITGEKWRSKVITRKNSK